MSVMSPISGMARRAPASIAIVLVLLVLVYKLLVVSRININWDEFYFLSNTYALTRGELSHVFQGAYTHLFTWLTAIPGTEIDQIVAARRLMVLLLALTAGMVWMLARTWLAPFSASVALLTYLTTYPVLQHGGSFRIDSMLAPLTVSIILTLVRGTPGPGRDLLAGLLCGLAFAATVKSVLLAPMVAVLVWVCRRASGDGALPGRAFVTSLLRIGIAGGVTALLTLGLHAASLPHAPAEGTGEFASRVASRTLLDVPWLPRVDYLLHSFRSQPLPWLLIVFGAVAAALRRHYVVLAMSLSLWPILAYRNAFPYYYVVMLAPASVLAGFAVQSVLEFLDRSKYRSLSGAFALLLLAGLGINARAYFLILANDQQETQRAVIDGIHSIFLTPVDYIDRCGMVSSFPKANFFMSSWGMTTYHDRGIPVFDSILKHRRPAFVLENAPALVGGLNGPTQLLPEDAALLDRFYLRYWGPIRVAGGEALVGPGGVVINTPFPGRYMLTSRVPVVVDGIHQVPGSVVVVPAHGVRVASIGPGFEPVRLTLAAARPPPGPVKMAAIFTGL